jgi:hypothetical protein
MPSKNPLQLKAAETIKYLRDENCITKEHSFTIALIQELAAEWSECTSSTQRAGISKELRAAYELLPKPGAKVSDEADEFMASLSEDV